MCLREPKLCLYAEQMFDIGYSGIKHVLKPISPGRGLFSGKSALLGGRGILLDSPIFGDVCAVTMQMKVTLPVGFMTNVITLHYSSGKAPGRIPADWK